MVEHRGEQRQFVIETEAGMAWVDYRIEADQLSVLSTHVPESVRGKGVAARLTEAVLNYCRKGNLALKPVCSYTISFLRRSPPDDVEIRW